MGYLWLNVRVKHNKHDTHKESMNEKKRPIETPKKTKSRDDNKKYKENSW